MDLAVITEQWREGGSYVIDFGVGQSLGEPQGSALPLWGPSAIARPRKKKARKALATSADLNYTLPRRGQQSVDAESVG